MVGAGPEVEPETDVNDLSGVYLAMSSIIKKILSLHLLETRKPSLEAYKGVYSGFSHRKPKPTSYLSHIIRNI